MASVITFSVALTLAIVAVVIHHECLVGIKCGLLERRARARRWQVGATVLLLLLSHAVQIVFFAAGLYVLVNILGIGGLSGPGVGEFQTFLYFSFSSYTSLGIGDLYPQGELRLITGFEALLGLLLIGWSASFLYLEMRSLWIIDKND